MISNLYFIISCYSYCPSFLFIPNKFTTALWTISIISLATNVAVFVHVYKIVKGKKNPLKDEIYTDLKAYKEMAADQ
ncbi:MAG: DUF5692 family protein [Bacillus sp. (in: firmicutes)]